MTSVWRWLRRGVRSRVILLPVVLLVWGCSIGSPGVEVGREVAQNFYQAMAQGDTDGALAYFADNHTPESWRSHLDNIRDSLGQVESFQPGAEEVNTVLSGRLYIFEYQVRYDSQVQAKETLTLFDPVGDGTRPRIVSQVIVAEGFEPVF